LNFFAWKSLFEVELDLVDINTSVEHTWLVRLQNVVKLLQTSIGRKCFRLNLILVSFFIKTKTIPCDWRIDSGSECCVLFDDVSLSSFDFDILPCLIHLTENFDAIALDLCQGPFLVFRLFETDFFCALSVLLFSFLFSFDQGTLQ